MEDALRLFAAGYLLVLAVAAIWGQHRSLLIYPARTLYAFFRIAVFALSFGRIRITPRLRRTVIRGRRMRRSFRRAVADVREERAEEASGGWVSVRDESPAPANVKSHSGGE